MSASSSRCCTRSWADEATGVATGAGGTAESCGLRPSPRATQGLTGLVYDVALSGDGRLVASGGFDGTVRLWQARSRTCLRTLRADRCYERLDITGLSGVTESQRIMALVALGAVDRST